MQRCFSSVSLCCSLLWLRLHLSSLVFFSKPHQTLDRPSCLCLLRPVSVPSTGKCHCSARLEATGRASYPFTSSSLCGESKTMAPLDFNSNGSYKIHSTVSAIVTVSFKSLDRNHWSKRPHKHFQGLLGDNSKRMKAAIQFLSLWNWKEYHRAFVMASVCLTVCTIPLYAAEKLLY